MNKWKAIAAELRVLSTMPLDSENDMDACCTQADQLQHQLEMEYKELTATLPHFVWHYLSDADIRFKDKRYKQNQDAEIASIIQELEQRK
jgi:hypothetical protein